MAFKLFTARGWADPNKLSLRKCGTLFISHAFLKALSIDIPNSAILLFDDELPRMGIKLSPERNSCEVGSRLLLKEKSGVCINILPVLRYYGVEKLSKRLKLEVKRQDDLLIVDLKQVLTS